MKSNIPFKQRKSFKKHGLKQCGPTNSRSFFRKDMPKRSQASFGNPDNIPASSNKMPSRRDLIRAGMRTRKSSEN